MASEVSTNRGLGTHPIIGGFDITPGTAFAYVTRQIYATGAGNITGIFYGQSTSYTFAIGAGERLPFSLKSVSSATATGLQGFY